MLLKCCTQYAGKFGKLSSGHRTAKGQFSFQSQRKAMPKSVQTTAQLHSFRMLTRSCSKSSKLGFNSMWTENFRMYKLDLEKVEEPEIKLSTSVGSWKSKRIPEKHLLLLHWVHQSLCVDHNKLWGILKEIGIPEKLTCLLRNLYAGQEAIVRTEHGTIDWFKIGKGVCQSCILSPCLFNLYAEYKMPGWMKHKLESILPGEISITSGMQMTPPLWQKAEEELKSLLKVKEESESESCVVMSDSLRPRELYSPWNFLGQNTGVGNLSLLQGIFPTPWLNPGLLHCSQILYQLSRKGHLRILEWVAYPFSSGSSWLRNPTRVSCIEVGFFTNWASREAWRVKKLA